MAKKIKMSPRHIEVIEFAGWQSKRKAFTKNELNIIVNAKCACEYCHESIFELDDFPVVKNNEVLCEHCYSEKYYLACPICENHYDKPTEPGGFFFVSENVCEQIGVAPGIYKIIEWPYIRSCLVYGFDNFVPGSIKLLRKCHPVSMCNSLNNQTGSLEGADEICPDCAEKYIGETYKPIKWLSKDGLNRNVRAWGIIQNGK